MPFQLTASTQYGDMTGTCSIDFHQGTNYLNLARDRGLDTDRFFFIALQFNIGDFGHFNAYLYAIDAADIGNDYENVQAFIRANRGPLPVHRFCLEDVSLDEVLRHIKRLDIVATKRGLIGDEEVTIVNE